MAWSLASSLSLGSALAADVPFVTQTPISAFANGAESAYAADLDGDGDVDVLSASSGDDKIVWYENDGNPGPSFLDRTIATSNDSFNSVFAADVDGDGDVDVLSASEFVIAWYENDGNPDPTFAMRTISTGSSTSSGFAADIDGDGDVDVLSSHSHPYTGGIYWYENDGALNPSFELHTISADSSDSVFAADMDRDGDVDVLLASDEGSSLSVAIAWYENDGDPNPSFESRAISFFPSAHSVFAADVDGDGDRDLLSASRSGLIAWHENDGNADPAFVLRTISTTASLAGSVFAADVDGDGDVDVLSASSLDDKIAWYENDGNADPAFILRTISTTADFAVSVFAADLDGDGDVDVLSASRDDNKIAWYRNDRAHGPEVEITSAIGSANEVIVADVDGDGDMDTLSASGAGYVGQVVWQENSLGDGSTWIDRAISTPPLDAVKSVAAGDIDGDDDVDVLWASRSLFSSLLAWHENLDDSGGSWGIQTISDTVSAESVAVADVDGDGDMDALSAGYSRVLWFENTAGDGSLWARQTITESVVDAQSVVAANLDGDGDVDVLSASYSDDKIAWYENDGSEGFTLHTITTGADGARSVFAADIDGDGAVDVLSASSLDDKIAWYENAAGDGSAWTLHTVAISADDARSVTATDVDEDGDMDILSASSSDDKIAWYENTAGDGSNWALRTIAVTANGARSVAAADINGDGEVDAVSGSSSDPNVAWYRIEIPQIRVTPMDNLVTSEIGDGESLEIRLRAQATGDVNIDVGITPADEALADRDVVTFTPLNWAIPQILVITGEDDPAEDGDVDFTVFLNPMGSDEVRYAGLDTLQVSGVNLDDEQGDISVNPTTGLTTTEAAGVAQFSVVLTLIPGSDVRIDVVSLDPSEGVPDQASLTFSSLNWNIPQNVIVTGQNDQIEDGDVAYTIQVGPVTASNDYANIDPDDVSLTNIDDGNDIAGVTVSPTSGLTTTEAGGIAQFNVNLTSEPADDISIAVTSGDPSEGLPDKAALNFNPTDWQTLQTVIVTGREDPLDDGDVLYTIQLGPITSNDAVYAAIDPDDVSLTNIDDDENVAAGVFVSPTSGLTTSEGGDSAQFEVVLITQPGDAVSIGVASDDTSEGVADAASLSFTTANWNIEQTVSVTGQDDAATDGDVGYSVVLGPILSNDAVYAAIDPDDVSLTNIDDEPIFVDGFED